MKFIIASLLFTFTIIFISIEPCSALLVDPAPDIKAVYQNTVVQQEQLPQKQHGLGLRRATLMKPEFHEVLREELQKRGHGQPAGRGLPNLNVKPPSNEQQHVFSRNYNGNTK
ncbi:uncharacterized protein LOC117178996 [Belonocnema kinseyi]|uniref:uncharacterized protein LOC117178996 n=1 Tax=Belonocnema kinseyi TaxID=2817044 RepID=UPI00143DF543|nr:uncharacterized protein LOC117178996 [Belonocnema kinseyi]